jgi:hypothetical protein
MLRMGFWPLLEYPWSASLIARAFQSAKLTIRVILFIPRIYTFIKSKQPLIGAALLVLYLSP